MCNNSCAFKCDQNQNGQADAPPDGMTESQLNQYKQDVCTMIGTDCIKEATTGDDDSDAIGYPFYGVGVGPLRGTRNSLNPSRVWSMGLARSQSGLRQDAPT